MTKNLFVNGKLLCRGLIISLRCPAFLLRPDQVKKPGCGKGVDVMIQFGGVFLQRMRNLLRRLRVAGEGAQETLPQRVSQRLELPNFAQNVGFGNGFAARHAEL